jgi:Domain of unknown function (DUF5710)
MAKSLGARWDPARRSWYAEDVSVARALRQHWCERSSAADNGAPDSPAPRHSQSQQSAGAARLADSGEKRIYFSVPFAEKDAAKELGARWDTSERSWYAPSALVATAMESRWPCKDGGVAAAPAAAAAGGAAPTSRQYFYIPFEEKDEAKGMGARWDPDMHAWYADRAPVAAALAARWQRSRAAEPVELIGEFRGYGGQRLFVDLIPSTT